MSSSGMSWCICQSQQAVVDTLRRYVLIFGCAAGDVGAAQLRFDRLLSYAGPLGLFAEQIGANWSPPKNQADQLGPELLLLGLAPGFLYLYHVGLGFWFGFRHPRRPESLRALADHTDPAERNVSREEPIARDALKGLVGEQTEAALGVRSGGAARGASLALQPQDRG